MPGPLKPSSLSSSSSVSRSKYFSIHFNRSSSNALSASVRSSFRSLQGNSSSGQFGPSSSSAACDGLSFPPVRSALFRLRLPPPPRFFEGLDSGVAGTDDRSSLGSSNKTRPLPARSTGVSLGLGLLLERNASSRFRFLSSLSVGGASSTCSTRTSATFGVPEACDPKKDSG